MKTSITIWTATFMLACGATYVHAQYESPLSRTSWSDNSGYKFPEPMSIVDYGTMPVQLTLLGQDVMVNGRKTSQLNASDLKVLEAAAGKNVAAIAQVLKEQRRPATMQIEFAVMKQIDSGQLLRMPIAMLDPADQAVAIQAGRQILQQRQFLAQMAAAQVLARAAGVAVPGVPTVPGLAGANYEQEGQFEGQFGDQTGPDLPGAGGIED